jgi:ribosomal protein S18 acetylase RimI-like enzyme
VPTLRRTEPSDSRAVGPLILEAAESLEIVFGNRGEALHGIDHAYRADRTEISHRFGLVAEEGDSMQGIVIAFPGGQYGSLKLGTGVVLARAAGTKHITDLVRRARVLDRLLPTPPKDVLYVSVLAVDGTARRRGTATSLLRRVIDAATSLGRGVAIDTGIENEPARALYGGLGFKEVSMRETTEAERKLLPTRGMLRMELRPALPSRAVS